MKTVYELSGSNKTIDFEVKGFEEAMKLLNADCRLGWSREAVLEFAEQYQKRARPSQRGAGFMDAARIIASTRPHNYEMAEEEIIEEIKTWPVTDNDTGIVYANLREFAEKTGKVQIEESEE